MIDLTALNQFSAWVNELTDEDAEKADELGISGFELAGLRPDAPKYAQEAFERFLENENRARKNRAAV